MENPQKIGRCSSCRGVAFEIKPHLDPFAITTPSIVDPTVSQQNWFSWGSSSRIIPSSILMQTSNSITSSHFCDLDLDEDNENDDDGQNLKSLEKGPENEEPNKELPIPIPPPKPIKPKGSRLSFILLDQGLFTVYKRLFVVCLAVNITWLALAATGNFQYGRHKAVFFSIANILALTLCRSEAFLRVVFFFAVKALGWPCVPLQVKTATTAFLQSLGGVHSGCAVSSIAWLIYALVLILIKDRENTSSEIIAVASTILSLLSLSSLAAFPLVRHLHHNVFERTHRYTGWTALGLVWAFIILTISYDPITKSYSNQVGSKLVRLPEFWFTLAITVLIVIPWVSVRRVPVKVTAPSGHASIIKFEGGVKAGLLGRISQFPLSEWHAFGIISDDRQEHMMLAGAVGDFTKSLVLDPPTHLWVRRVHFAGLPYLVNMYDRVLLVATGSGICVFLSFLLQPCKADVCLLWVARGIEQNFGKEIQEMVSGYPKEKVIVHDTAVLGRPNVSKISVEVARNWKAQVVIVTSNPEGSRDVVTACKASGIPAFGPIWDS